MLYHWYSYSKCVGSWTLTDKVGQGQTKASRLMLKHRSHQRRLRSVIAVNNERLLRSFNILVTLVVLWLNTRLLVRWVRGFNFPVARAYLRFTSRASTLTGKQCWLCDVRLQQTVIVLRSVVGTSGLILRLQTWRWITNGRSETKIREGAYAPDSRTCRPFRGVSTWGRYITRKPSIEAGIRRNTMLYHLKWNINAWDTAIPLHGHHFVPIMEFVIRFVSNLYNYWCSL